MIGFMFNPAKSSYILELDTVAGDVPMVSLKLMMVVVMPYFEIGRFGHERGRILVATAYTENTILFTLTWEQSPLNYIGLPSE